MARSLGRSLSIVALLVFLTAVGRAEIFTAYLTSAQEVPPSGTGATGYARVIVNESAGTIAFRVVFNNLSSNQTLSHIHAPAAIGANVGVAINFGAVGGTSGTIIGTAAITPTQLSQLRQHLGYVNVHSVNFGNGEIRGQLGVERPLDLDGDGRTDFSVLRFPNISPPGQAPISWYNLNSTGGVQAVGPFGDANLDFPTPGDYDGDGICDIAVYRTGANAGDPNIYWILQSASNTYRVLGYGLPGDQPIPRDFDGDGKVDPAIFRRGANVGDQAVWWIRSSITSLDIVVPFGLTGDDVAGTGDEPIPGDYDGDGKFDVAVYRHGISSPNNAYIIFRSSDGVVTFQQFGNFTSDWILPGDYDGDGKYDLAVARTGATSTAPLVWWILQSSTGTTRTQTFGRSSDRPTQGDYDGDARTDLSVYRAGASGLAQSFFWVQNSFDNTTPVTNWGLGVDFAQNTFDSR